MSKEKARRCVECVFSIYPVVEGLLCRKGHKPRFYEPKNIVDDDWGWKRRCEDFETKEDK